MMIRLRKPITYSCSFCSKNQRQVKRLIAGPGGVYVCNECVASFVSTSATATDEQDRRCSFCGKHQTPILAVIEGPHRVSICQECIDLCVEIITEEERLRSGDGKPE